MSQIGGASAKRKYIDKTQQKKTVGKTKEKQALKIRFTLQVRDTIREHAGYEPKEYTDFGNASTGHKQWKTAF